MQEKQCPRCKAVFDVKVFGIRMLGGKPRPKVYCPECTKLYRREHYYSNKLVYRKRAKENNEKYKAISRKYIYEYLSIHPCVDCGETDVRVLAFDHVRGLKSANIGNMQCNSIATIIKEIEKCDVRCANCHLIVTGKRSNVWWTKLDVFAPV